MLCMISRRNPETEVAGKFYSLYNIERFVDIHGEIVNVNLDRKDRYTVSNDKLYKL